VDFGGSPVLSVQTVNYGSYALAPSPLPDSRGDDYWCSGWDQTFYSVTSNMTITAVYSYIFTFSESGNELTVIGYHDKGTLTSITIPSAYDDKDVVGIAANIFASNVPLTSITVPNSITFISDSAFAKAYLLQSITLPFVGTTATATEPLGHLFGSIDYSPGNTYLANPNHIPNSLNSITITNTAQIPQGAFQRLQVPNIAFTSNVTSIGNSAFAYNNALTTLTISSNLSTLGTSVFAYCANLTTVTFPSSVTSVPANTFSNCPNLLTFDFTNITSIGQQAFYHDTSLNNIVLGANLTSIGMSAFADCSGLTSISIPATLTSLGLYAFQDCVNLAYVIVSDGATSSIMNDAFKNCTSLANIYIPNTVNTISVSAFSGCPNVTIYTSNSAKPTTWLPGSILPANITLVLNSSLLEFMSILGL
jgi:hypothetical protein